MKAVEATAKMTAAEYFALGESADARRLELVEGEVVVHEPLPMHGDVQGEILIALRLWAREKPERGQAWLPLDVGIDEHNVFAPDIAWYRDGRGPGRSSDHPQPIPDLAVEVRSRSTWKHDIGAKKRIYERERTPELWLLDTAAEVVLVYRRSRPEAPTFDIELELDRHERLTSPLLPGFALDLAVLFPAGRP